MDNTIQLNVITQAGQLQTEHHINSDLAPEKNRIMSKKTNQVQKQVILRYCEIRYNINNLQREM